MIADNLGAVRERIAKACLGAGRPVQSVTLLAVSKGVAAAAVLEALRAGQTHFGENYAQEGVGKIDALSAWRSQLTWHMIGPLQSNKTRAIAEAFDWVHSIDRIRIAQRLSEQRPAGRAPLQVCLQVNVSGEVSKGGIAPREAAALARAVTQLPGLRLRGLMSIPEPTPDERLQRARHRELRELLLRLNSQGNAGPPQISLTPTGGGLGVAQPWRGDSKGMALDTLSMGMSADLEAAIAEGATIVRVGTAIFGARPTAGRN